MSEKIQIESLKADKSRHRLWHENYLLYQDNHCLIGYNDKTNVEQWDGEVFTTHLPALFYFEYAQWFNIIYLHDPQKPYYYCNLSSPVTFSNHKITYIDYDIDIIVQKDYTYHVVDELEFTEHAQSYPYKQNTIKKILHAKQTLIERIENQKNPFNHAFLNYWLKKMEENIK